MKLPLFPLPIFLLPQGVTRLRIFEARYLKMVKIAAANNGFLIQLSHKDNREVTWASWVEIINFDQGNDGVLQIDVKCKSLVNIDSIEQDKDKLDFANTQPKQHWPLQQHDEISLYLSSSLKSVFAENKELSTIYNHNFIDEANWVVARWLEILPIKLLTKNNFSNKESFDNAKEFLHSILITNSVTEYSA